MIGEEVCDESQLDQIVFFCFCSGDGTNQDLFVPAFLPRCVAVRVARQVGVVLLAPETGLAYTRAEVRVACALVRWNDMPNIGH